MLDYAKLINECEQHIRGGFDFRVAKILGKLNLARVPRQWRLPMANVARRTSQIATGLRLLTPLIRSAGEKVMGDSTSAERAEYAILLQRAGSAVEAIEVLKSVDVKEVPAALLYRAFCHFNLWEYENSLPLLERYASLMDDPYQNLIARVNLGAANVATGDFNRAREILEACIQDANRSGHTRLRGNAHELLGQTGVLIGDLTGAGMHLGAAEAIFTVPGTLEHLFTAKSRAFLNASLTNSVEPLTRFRAMAAGWPHAESVREADLFSLIIEFDGPKFENLYFGTPFTGYRARIEKYLGVRPENSTFLAGGGPSELDVQSGSLDGVAVVPAGGVSHRLLVALARDLYRPLRTNALFASIFPGEYFNIFTSPVRVHQAIRRTRRELEARGVPLEIVSSKSGFSLKTGGGVSLKVPLNYGAVETNRRHLEKLARVFADGGFTAAEGRAALGISAPAMQRFLSWAKHDGRLEKFGASTSTRYFLAVKIAA